MNVLESYQVRQIFENRFQSVVDTWTAAVIKSNSEPKQEAKLREEISDLVRKIFALLLTTPLPDDQAQAAGMALARMDCIRREALTNSQKVLSNHLLQGISPEQADPLHCQLALLLGHFTLGFVQQTNSNQRSFKSQTVSQVAVPEDGAWSGTPPSADQFGELVLLLSGEIAEAQQQLRLETDERRRTERELRQRIQEMKLFSRATQIFNVAFDLDQILDSILDEVRALMGAYAYSAWLVDPKTEEVVCWRVTDEHSRIMLGWRLPLGRGIVGWVAKHGEGVIVNDTRRDSRHYRRIDQRLEIETRSVLSVPLHGRDSVIGVLQVIGLKPDSFTVADKDLLEFLAASAGIAIENVQMYDQSRRDAESKSVLLREINHRVKNNLTIIRSILHLKRSRISADNQADYQAITEDVMNYVQSLATVHHLLSSSDWAPVLLSELTVRVIETCVKVLSPDKYVTVKVSPASVWVTADQAHDFALIINELMTNTAKYALPTSSTSLEVGVQIFTGADKVRFEFRDNGVGYPEEVLSLAPMHHNLGFELIQNIVHNNLEGEISLYNDEGAVTVIEFPEQTNHRR